MSDPALDYAVGAATDSIFNAAKSTTRAIEVIRKILTYTDPLTRDFEILGSIETLERVHGDLMGMLYDVFPETTIKITKPENAVHLMDDVEAILRDHRDPEEAFE
jgi:hypothetical protein